MMSENLRTRRNIPEDERTAIFEVWGGKCVYCVDGDTVATHIDHIYPFAKGGSCELENLAPSCERHNLSKSDLVLPNAGLELLIARAIEKAPKIREKIKNNPIKNDDTDKPLVEVVGVNNLSTVSRRLLFGFLNNNGCLNFRKFMKPDRHWRRFEERMKEISKVNIITRFGGEVCYYPFFEGSVTINGGNVEYTINSYSDKYFKKMFDIDNVNYDMLNKFSCKYSVMFYGFLLSIMKNCDEYDIKISIEEFDKILFIDENWGGDVGSKKQKIYNKVLDDINNFTNFDIKLSDYYSGKRISGFKIEIKKTPIPDNKDEEEKWFSFDELILENEE